MNASLKALLNEQYKLVAELREENKNLKEWNNELIENHKKDIDVLCEENKELREENEILRCNKGGTPEKVGHEEMIQYLMGENKKLNIKVASLEGEIKGLNSVIDKLKEENQTLELWLDNKEKLNEEYRKQIDKYKRQYEHSMGEDDELIYEEGLYD